MVNKKVLAKVNKIIALSVTKSRVVVEIKGYLNPIRLDVGHCQVDNSFLYKDGTNNCYKNWIALERNVDCIDELNKTLEWLETLPDLGE